MVTLAVAAAMAACGVAPAVEGDAGSPATAPRCVSRSASEIAAELKALARHGIPDCLEVGVLGPGRTTSGPSTLTDIGWTRCRAREDDEVVECPLGLTMHIETKECWIRPCRAETPDREDAAAECQGAAIVGVACRIHYL